MGEGANGILDVALSVSPNSSETGAIWELQLSAFNETGKILGVFGEEARQMFRSTQTDPNFNKQQTVVSQKAVRVLTIYPLGY